MFYSEHVAAEALRYARLKAYASHNAHHHIRRWVYQLIGLRLA